MVNLGFLVQLVETKADAVKKLEAAKLKGDSKEFSRLKVFIFDIYKKIEEEISDESGSS